VAHGQAHDEPTAHFELLNQRRRDMVKISGIRLSDRLHRKASGCNDHCVERTTFRPSEITVADLDTDIVIAEFSQHLRSGFGQWRDNLNGTDLSNQTRQ